MSSVIEHKAVPMLWEQIRNDVVWECLNKMQISCCSHANERCNVLKAFFLLKAAKLNFRALHQHFITGQIRFWYTKTETEICTRLSIAPSITKCFVTPRQWWWQSSGEHVMWSKKSAVTVRKKSCPTFQDIRTRGSIHESPLLWPDHHPSCRLEAWVVLERLICTCKHMARPFVFRTCRLG